VSSEIDRKSAAKTRSDPQLNLSEEELDEEQQYEISSSGSNATLINTQKASLDSTLVDENSNLSTLDGPIAITDQQNVMKSSMSRIPMAVVIPKASSMKSLEVIFPSTSETKYEHMFLLEKIAFIYIELVVKRGYKAMTNWPFRNFAK
jgi:hypothetical protein